MFMWNFIAIHYNQVGLETFGKPEGYVKRQVGGWSERYRMPGPMMHRTLRS